MFSMIPNRIKPVDADKVNKATWYSQSMAHFLKNVFNKENTALTELPEWSQGSPKKAEDGKVSYNILC